jgi:hypothetical protein
MSKSRKAKTGSVLKKQKPKSQKNRRRLIPVNLQSLGYTCLAFALLAAGVLFTRGQLKSLSSKYWPESAANPSHWQFVIRSSDNSPISDTSQALVITTTRKAVGTGTHDDLLKSAKAVQKLGIFSDVRITKISPNQLIISLIQRQPVFCVEADKIRLVSSLGDIYGFLDMRSGETCPGPILSGLFEDKSSHTLSDGQTLIVDDQTKGMVQEALTLLQDVQKRSVKIEKFHIEKFRGFVVELSSQGTEVALGRAPFVEKLDKLNGILEKLAVRQEQAQRIELDYQGKAFVKLKKM